MALSPRHPFAFSSPPVAPSEIPHKLTSINTAEYSWSVPQDHPSDSTLIGQPKEGIRCDIDCVNVQHGQIKEAWRHKLKKTGEDSFGSICMIDAVQRLGVDNYFKEEIEAILDSHYVKYIAHGDCGYELHETALRFRLLRQKGLLCVCRKFKNKEGKLKKELTEDINGLMALYEASQLSIEGEDILDELGNLSEQALNAPVIHLDENQLRVVGKTLRNPYHKSLQRFMVKSFLSDFPKTNGWTNDLQLLAKVDFNMVQSIHQKEIVRIFEWWTDLGLSKELKFAKDQPLKWYICSMVCLIEPTLSEERVELTKPISLIYIIDDIFDMYGTVEELTLFTKAVNNWDVAGLEQSPEYMKICFGALYDITNEISCEIYRRHGWNPIDSLTKAWATLCNAFLVETTWLSSGHSLKPEQYLENTVITTGVHVVLVHTFFLLGQGITKESVNLVDNMPTIISSPSTILRLWDDLGTPMDEGQDGRDGSFIDYYLKEHQGSSIEEAQQKVASMISGAWKHLNRECLAPNPFPATFCKASLNVARMVPLLYGYDDQHCLTSLQEHVKSVLYESV